MASHPMQRKVKRRLDVAMVERGLVPTRARARDLIRRGLVKLKGDAATKAGAEVGPGDGIALSGEEVAAHVSRGGVKLIAGLDHFAFSVAGIVALDIGASTGGFSEALLARGATRVYAVDVGHGQLHPTLLQDERIVALEKCDARRLDAILIPQKIDAVVADVSFISLTKVLPAALALTGARAWLVALIKPQFELNRNAVGRRGIVRDPGLHQLAVDQVSTWLAEQPGWRVRGVIVSPIEGGSGNKEFLLGASHDA